MIGCLRTRVRKQPIIALYFESENELKLYNLEAWSSAWWHVCSMQTQINLAISIVACVPRADSNQPGHQHGGMYAQFRLKSTWPSA